jgi:hypothetical protein
MPLRVVAVVAKFAERPARVLALTAGYLRTVLGACS